MTYSPIWPIAYDDEAERQYLVHETKGTTKFDQLDLDETIRIRFAWKYFQRTPAGKVDYFSTIDEAKRRVNDEWTEVQEYVE
ncbi:MAG: hypothetical protein WD397_08620 [Wenzhouxiangellaceae bacterium]